MQDEPIIDVCNLSFEIENNTILSDVSFSIRKGEYVSILGPNGAGKSTLLKCLNRIVPLSRGTIRISGKNLQDFPQKVLAQTLGYVPQFREMAYPFTVHEFLLISRHPYLSPFRPPAPSDHAAVKKALELTGMSNFNKRRICTLSGGECQKIFIAAALTQETPVLLLDEPTAFLDPKYQSEINRLLKSLKNDCGTTVIAVSHDINSAVLGSDKILALKQGHIVFWGDAHDVMNPEILERIFDTAFTFVNHPVAGISIVVPEH